MFFFSGLLVTSCATINTLEKKFWWRQICSLLLCNAKLLIKITSLEIGAKLKKKYHTVPLFASPCLVRLSDNPMDINVNEADV